MTVRRILLSIVIILTMAFTSCHSIIFEEKNMDYKNQISTYLEKSLSHGCLCNERDAYDACMNLMVPMHYVFQKHNENGIETFTMQFSTFVDDYNEDEFGKLNTMYKLSWLYFSSQYMKLMIDTGRQSNIPTGLFDITDKEILRYWFYYKGSYKAEFTGMEELLQNVLYGKGYSIDQSYKHAICDVEQFIIAIMCDMSIIDDYYSDSNSVTHDKATEWAVDMMKVKVSWQKDGGWLFGVGDMADHQDYIYAGNDTIVEGIKPIRDPNIVDDVSHFSRMPLFLISFRDSQKSIDNYLYFDALRTGLAEQFINKVLFMPDEEKPYVRVTNYMDGKNGVYRYSYHEEGVGYEKWNLSGSFLNGWWTFLNDERIRSAYSILCTEIPFEKNEKKFYTSGVTVRELNPDLTSWGGGCIAE